MSDQVPHPLITSMENIANPPPHVDKTWTDNGYVISTVKTPDAGYETAVCREKNGKWHPVERYDSVDEAESGHQRWVNAMHQGPTSVLDLGLPGWVEPRVVDL
jgi:hypothetical protein